MHLRNRMWKCSQYLRHFRTRWRSLSLKADKFPEIAAETDQADPTDFETFSRGRGDPAALKRQDMKNYLMSWKENTED